MEGSKAILLVEDEALIGLLETRQLREEGYTVLHVFSGEEAIATVNAVPKDIDLILMDIDLGNGMDGTEAAQIILQDHDIPIVFLSSHTEIEVVEKTEKITSYGYVAKSSGINVLRASIKMAFKLHAAHQTLQRANEKLSLAQEASHAGTWDWDIVHNTFDWSPEFLKIHGMSHETTSGYESWLNTIFPEDREIAAQRMQEAIQLKIDLAFDFRVVLPDGNIRWIRATGKTYYDGDRPLRMIGLCTDITAHKRAEEKVYESNELLSLFISNSPIYAFIKEVVPTESRVLFSSENYQDMIGIPGSQMVGKTMEELFPTEFAKKMTGDDWMVASRGEVLKLDEDFNDRHYTTIKYPIALGGKNLLAGYTIDITEQKQAEASLRESEARLKRSLEEKEVLMHELQHRVKNSLMIATSLLSLEEDNLPDAHTRAIFANTRSRFQSIAALYEQLACDGAIGRINLGSYIENLVKGLSASYVQQTGGFHIEAKVEEVYLDIQTTLVLGIILNELVTNALKYAFPAGKTPSDEPGIIRVKLAQAAGQVRLCVFDNGVGIPAENRNSTGTGLELVMLLAQQIGGCFSIDGSNGCTACVIFRPET